MPSLSEQKRIVEILKRAEGIVRLRREQLAKTRALIPALFTTMFGDPATNPMGWEMVPIQDIAKFEGGKNLAAGHDERGFKILKVSAVTSGLYKETESKPAPSNFVPPESYIVKVGDLLFSRANTEQLVGATALVRETNGKTLLPDKLWRFVWKDSQKISSFYMWALFQSNYARQELSAVATGTSSSMKNISQEKLKKIRISLPPHDQQIAFEAKASLVRQSVSDIEQALEKQEALFQSLLHHAFAGTLTADALREEAA
ncbi:MAG: restriction endonuclease subunit S [Verrucomicrobiae bacterium]|nr:restriction endonuclease subunit S [Verrucomicrobiae bacterium]